MEATQQLDLVQEDTAGGATGIRFSFRFLVTSHQGPAAGPEQDTSQELQWLRAELEAVRYQNQCHALEKAQWLEDRRKLCLKLQRLKCDLQRVEDILKEKQRRSSDSPGLHSGPSTSSTSSALTLLSSSPSPCLKLQGPDTHSRWLSATKKNLQKSGITFLGNERVCEVMDVDLRWSPVEKESMTLAELKEALRKKKAEEKLRKGAAAMSRRKRVTGSCPSDQQVAPLKDQRDNVLLRAVRDIVTYMGRSYRRSRHSPPLEEELKVARKELKRWMKERLPPPCPPPLQIILHCPRTAAA